MKLSSITHGTVDRPARIVLMGVEKIGKSTFAAGAPAPIFIPVKGETGLDDLDVPRFPVCQSFSEVQDALGALAEEDHKFETVVIDSVSTLEPLIHDHICSLEPGITSIEKACGAYGKGYVEAVKYWRDIMAALDFLRDEKGMGCILIGHVAVKNFSDPTGDQFDTYVMDIHKGASAALYRWSDAILFANCKTIVKTEKVGLKETKKGILRSERCLFTQKRPAHPGGGRGAMGRIPYEVELSYDKWIEAVNAVKNAKE